MEYEAFCSLLENVPGQTQRLSAYDIIMMIAEYPRPTLPWTAIMQIRRKGYVSNSKLHDILTREGFTKLGFSQPEAAYITQY
ncbi:MAG: hypothetical protein PHW33_03620, partial [Candidatus Portnoybacteria bacterium]|nr:hypothetical protein [Candidatus Portnoybacteria bacterium]